MLVVWRNIRITSKLLLGFGLLLFVFVIAVGLTWKDSHETNQNNVFLSDAVVPSVTTAIDYERAVYEVFMIMKDVQSFEKEEDIKDVLDGFAKTEKAMAVVADLYRKYPVLRSSAYIVETVAPLAKQYADSMNKTIDAIRKKRELLATITKLGTDMVTEITTNVDDVYNILKTSIGNADNERLTYLANLLYTTVEQEKTALSTRTAFRMAIADGDATAMRKAAAQLPGIEKSFQDMMDASKTQEQKDRNARTLKIVKDYEAIVNSFADALEELANISTARYKVRDAIDEGTTKASTMGFNRSKEISQESVKKLNGSINVLLSTAGVSIILGLIIAVFISRSIAKPLGVIVNLAGRAGEGDLTIERADFKYEGADELAKLSDAIHDMVSAQESSMREVVEVAESLVGGAQTLSGISEESNASMEEIKASIEQVTSLSESNGAALEECNAGVEEMSAGADTVAQSATDSAAFISQTTDGSHKAAEMVNSTTKGMRNVETNSKESEAKIRQLVDSVQNVSGFVSVITGIADQTNLLALNAAIEAARAGEVGRGFAVVAEEVRKLAEESAKAAQNVNGIITELQSGAQGSIKATVEAGKVLAETLVQAEQAQSELDGAINEINKANDSIQNIAAVAEEQAASSREIAVGIDKATKSTIEMVNTVSGIRGAVDNTAQAAQNVAVQAEAIAQYSDKLSGVLSRFKLRAVNEKNDAKSQRKELAKPKK
jgi:methyl-accepting chemotaxis protein